MVMGGVKVKDKVNKELMYVLSLELVDSLFEPLRIFQVSCIWLI